MMIGYLLLNNFLISRCCPALVHIYIEDGCIDVVHYGAVLSRSSNILPRFLVNNWSLLVNIAATNWSSKVIIYMQS